VTHSVGRANRLDDARGSAGRAERVERGQAAPGRLAFSSPRSPQCVQRLGSVLRFARLTRLIAHQLIGPGNIWTCLCVLCRVQRAAGRESRSRPRLARSHGGGRVLHGRVAHSTSTIGEAVRMHNIPLSPPRHPLGAQGRNQLRRVQICECRGFVGLHSSITSMLSRQEPSESRRRRSGSSMAGRRRRPNQIRTSPGSPGLAESGPRKRRQRKARSRAGTKARD
jgi:hypothetical protein